MSFFDLVLKRSLLLFVSLGLLFASVGYDQLIQICPRLKLDEIEKKSKAAPNNPARNGIDSCWAG